MNARDSISFQYTLREHRTRETRLKYNNANSFYSSSAKRNENNKMKETRTMSTAAKAAPGHAVLAEFSGFSLLLTSQCLLAGDRKTERDCPLSAAQYRS